MKNVIIYDENKKVLFFGTLDFLNKKSFETILFTKSKHLLQKIALNDKFLT